MNRERDSGTPYVLTWLGLLALTAASYSIDRLGLGAWGFAASLSIAVLKAGVVLLVFMHLTKEPFVIRFVAILNVLYVLLICVGIAADVAAR
jgi:cytochrome c oxidase subunit 4